MWATLNLCHNYELFFFTWLLKSILEYNGGAVVAMVGKGCVAVASDLRFGVQAQTIGFNNPKVHRVNDKCFVGLAGLASDNQTVYPNYIILIICFSLTSYSLAKIKFRANMYRLREDRDIRPSVLANMISTLLYEKRYVMLRSSCNWKIWTIFCGTFSVWFGQRR